MSIADLSEITADVNARSCHRAVNCSVCALLSKKNSSQEIKMDATMGTALRVLTPIVAPFVAYYLFATATSRWRNKLYPLPAICQIIALLLLISIGLAWATGSVCASKDATYVIFTILLSINLVMNCTDDQIYREMISSISIFMIGFLLYSAAEAGTNERVLLAPVLSILLIDMIIAIQNTNAKI